VAPTPLSSSSSLPSATAMGALPPARDKSDLEQWRTRSVRWARASPEWGPKTLA
jgi:hypothetical protein